MQSVDLIRYWRESFARVQPFTFLDDPLKAIHQIEVLKHYVRVIMQGASCCLT
jgi:hypothetical protein